jgi:short-subunit dehydrogenase
MSNSKNKTALITGATAGIGRAYAFELASRGMDLVLVARDNERLTLLANELKNKFDIKTEILVADLTNKVALGEVACRAAADDIELVINNAGFGIKQDFVGGGLAAEQDLLDVLVGAVLQITHAAMPGLVARNSGGVINVSSVAGWLSSGTYSSAKAWVTSFSEALAFQHRASKVHVMALCPGYTRTEFHQRANMEISTVPNWMWLDVDKVVKTSLKDFARNKPVSVPGLQYKILSFVAQYLPRPVVRRISNTSRR